MPEKEPVFDLLSGRFKAVQHFFEQNGIFYRLEIIPYDGWGQIEDGGEAARAVLKEVLDSIEPAA